MFNCMVEFQTLEMDTVFHALGDATRRRMLRDLSRGARTVGQLAEPFDMSLAAASKHIKALEHAGLIRREVQGRMHLCHLEPAPLERAHGWLGFYQQFWAERLDALDEVLADPEVRAELEAMPRPK
jgi:DNA-binding transcriptional ArsR family regulator